MFTPINLPALDAARAFLKAGAALETPDLSCMDKDGLCAMLLMCGMSSDPSDRAFAKACRDELARRKD